MELSVSKLLQSDFEKSMVKDKHKSTAERKWNELFNDWQMGKASKPPAHPEKEHLWNVDPEAYLEIVK